MVRARGGQYNSELILLKGVGPSSRLGDLVEKLDLFRQWRDRRLDLIDAHARHVDRRRVHLAELRCPREQPEAFLVCLVLDLRLRDHSLELNPSLQCRLEIANGLELRQMQLDKRVLIR